MKKRRKREEREEREKNACILTEGVVIYGSRLRYGPLVKRLRRRPLTAETGVRFPYGLLRKCETLKHAR